MFLQMVLKTIAVLKLAFPFVAAEENRYNSVFPLSEFRETKHSAGIVIGIVIAAIATDSAHLLRFLLHVFTFPQITGFLFCESSFQGAQEPQRSSMGKQS
jgi:hypothetical protein